MGVELWETLETWIEGLTITVERKKFSAENICAWLDVAWYLDLISIAIGNDLFISPFPLGYVITSPFNLEEVDLTR